MKNYPDFFSVLIGAGGPGFLLGYIVIAFICASAIILFDLSQRDVSSTRTPEKLSLRFWIADNLARIMANLLLIPIAIRMCYEYVNPTWMLFLSAGIGFGFDALGLLAKRSGLLTTNKLAERITDRINNAKS